MTWARFDDRFHGNRKVRRAWRRNRGSVGLYSMAVTYCAQHETDGLVDADWIEDTLPTAAERRRIVEILVEVGLFTVEGDDYRINDYLEYNPSADTLAEQRHRDSTRKAKSRAGGVQADTTAVSGRSPSGQDSDSARIPNGLRAESERSPVDPSRARALPGPARPVPKDPPGPPPGGNRKRAQEEWREQVVTWAQTVGVAEPSNGRRVSGDHVLKAYKTAEPWLATDPAAALRDAAVMYYSEALVVEAVPA